MRFVTLLAPDRTEHIGVLTSQNKIIDLVEVQRLNAHPLKLSQPHQNGPQAFGNTVFNNMVEFIKAESILIPWAKEVVAKIASLPAGCVLNESDCILISPIPHPTSCRDGYAFRQHVEAARRGRGVPMIEEFDHFPIFYFTNHLAITGPGEIFVMEKALERLDFELEVAIVIKKEGRNIPAANADDYIFGYMIMNDWSARELQTQEMKLNLGPAKGKDFATSLGPYLVTPDEFAEKRIAGPNGERFDLRMQAFHNGKQVSDGNLKDMTWTFGQIIERASYGVTLYPGEVIGSGTVGTGCYMELNLTSLKDNPVWIKPGDAFALEVEGMGRLENVIRKANH